MLYLPWVRRSFKLGSFCAGSARIRGKKRHPQLAAESLENRCVLALTPTGIEQEMLELVNQFRSNPGANFEVMVADPQVSSFLKTANVNVSAARTQIRALPGNNAPLAWDEALLASADQHSAAMRAANRLSHSTHSPEVLATGNITAPAQMQPITLHAELAIDFVTRGSAGDANRDGILDDPAHRELLLADNINNVGIGIVTNRRGTQNEMWVTQHFDADAASDNPYVLGVVYNDANSSGRYNSGEGLGGVTITLVSGSRTVTTTTLSTGGYQVRVPAGRYTVTASGAGLTGSVAMGTVTVNDENVKRDLNTRGGSPPPDDDPTPGQQISGFIFSDTDGDGRRDTGEAGVAGWTVYVDSNNNGQRDTGERTTTSGSNGFYRLANLPVGTLTVRAISKSGGHFTTPNTLYIATSESAPVTGKHFGTSSTATRGAITGFVFDDLNLDGARQSTDTAVANWTVFVDSNNNGSRDAGEQFVQTTSAGFYRLEGLTPGNHTIRISSVAIRGLAPFTPTARIVNVAAGVSKGGNHFGLTSNSTKSTSVSGFVFDDRDGDGRKDAGEPGVGSHIVYVDANKNGQRDASEIYIIVSQTGFYRFSGLGAGRHVIGIELANEELSSRPTQHTIDVVLGQWLSGKNFGVA